MGYTLKLDEMHAIYNTVLEKIFEKPIHQDAKNVYSFSFGHNEEILNIIEKAWRDAYFSSLGFIQILSMRLLLDQRNIISFKFKRGYGDTFVAIYKIRNNSVTIDAY
jgi:hypothetical protein